MSQQHFEPLHIPHTLAAGPGPGNTDPRVLERFAQCGVAATWHGRVQVDVEAGISDSERLYIWSCRNWLEWPGRNDECGDAGR